MEASVSCLRIIQTIPTQIDFFLATRTIMGYLVRCMVPKIPETRDIIINIDEANDILKVMCFRRIVRHYYDDDVIIKMLLLGSWWDNLDIIFE